MVIFHSYVKLPEGKFYSSMKTYVFLGGEPLDPYISHLPISWCFPAAWWNSQEIRAVVVGNPSRNRNSGFSIGFNGDSMVIQWWINGDSMGFFMGMEWDFFQPGPAMGNPQTRYQWKFLAGKIRWHGKNSTSFWLVKISPKKTDGIPIFGLQRWFCWWIQKSVAGWIMISPQFRFVKIHGIVSKFPTPLIFSGKIPWFVWQSPVSVAEFLPSKEIKK